MARQITETRLAPVVRVHMVRTGEEAEPWRVWVDATVLDEHGERVRDVTGDDIAAELTTGDRAALARVADALVDRLARRLDVAAS